MYLIQYMYIVHCTPTIDSIYDNISIYDIIINSKYIIILLIIIINIINTLINVN